MNRFDGFVFGYRQIEQWMAEDPTLAPEAAIEIREGVHQFEADMAYPI
jgi:hypothetical protein